MGSLCSNNKYVNKANLPESEDSLSPISAYKIIKLVAWMKKNLGEFQRLI